jgi:hypothetical protein
MFVVLAKKFRFWLWLYHTHECDFDMMHVNLTKYVLNYFITVFINKFMQQAHACSYLKNYHTYACQINTQRSMVPYYVSSQHACAKIQ